MQLLLHALFNCGPQTRLIFFFFLNKVSSQFSIAYKLIDERSLFFFKELIKLLFNEQAYKFIQEFLNSYNQASSLENVDI